MDMGSCGTITPYVQTYCLDVYNMKELRPLLSFRELKREKDLVVRG